ncbi:phosphogluconate dehydratase [Campylobacter hepaticus]|uniref:Phosphogluconate dehydratase n=1 Tax=Campylobacter hepaticus TaxID=1813019 RepID=A0A6A7JUB6_9BACT|nr:phosphogluconate dehydratase [Campylobacter hepaticus]AXP08689.1 phosphogluconate dehydratase [Campylobacter hepaticus]MCZ0772534.1 phosphogluconate dehydratase [Campylobacter hepaticus]MCZ0774002.1 phosphogluconate dehydratase [Campylobacter hepaticus]MCZ0775254.1 phosphogluconate dehydratase [Campylobacter hepaticus]MDX2324014.1 phosphogluconate dehydratase [Campylobacter hepaticus]
MAQIKLKQITQNIIDRSKKTRENYLERIQTYKGKIQRKNLACANLAHTYASIPKHIKEKIKENEGLNYAIISAYNDMLSAHQPFKNYPDIIKKEIFKHNAFAQFAGGTPAMCDGITQGYEGMELSLFSRDVIAMSVAIALSHNVFDGAFYLGVCDKIVPGLLIGALSFGHLPSIFIPSGPMTSGISNDEKSKTRQLFAEGKISRDALLQSEMKSYHDVGTCTFYGTANSNQMMIEFMGLHLANSAFINPNTTLREALVKQAALHMVKNQIKSIGELLSEKNIVNAMIGLMATGGSTNHTIHLIAVARTAGIIINWDDFNAISNIIPLLARVYPNGKADINQFEAAGGIAFIIHELLKEGLLHDDVDTVMGKGMQSYTQNPFFIDNKIVYKNGVEKSKNENILRSIKNPFLKDGGVKILKGNIGRAVIKISAVKEEHQIIKAPALVFNSQQEFIKSFENKELQKDFIAIIPYQGPRANGMPELHKLTPLLGSLQDQGFKVALITDGRMSGASGKIPAAIHMSPEALLGGNIAKIKNGDMILFDAKNGILEVLLDEKEWKNRKINEFKNQEIFGCGRELFAGFRSQSSSAETGAMSFGGYFN